MNIGITVNIAKENQSLFSNGVIQNAIFLVKLFRQAGHNAYLVNASEIQAPYTNKVNWDCTKIPTLDWSAAQIKTDVLLLVGVIYDRKSIEEYKSLNKNNKVIYYVAGNKYIMDMEGVMFNLEDRQSGYDLDIDELWVLPQHWNTCKDYLRVLYNLDESKVKQVPFVWDPMFLDMHTAKYTNQPDKELNEKMMPIYLPNKDNANKTISVFEPNINVVKWSMIPTLIMEDYYRNGGDFNKINLFGAKKLIESELYKGLLSKMDMFMKDPVKINILPRVEIVIALTNTDVVVAHQWENPLNYAYLDALYLNFPLVHNAPMIKDAGYYYPEFNIEEGRKQLEFAMNNHDGNIESYNDRSENVLTRYTGYNTGMVELYTKLLQNAVDPNTHEVSGEYNWETNTYL
ncbi:DUF2827 domain-containing protein [bacterium]|nr:DUF2827 domain-containing protein [bacterium]